MMAISMSQSAMGNLLYRMEPLTPEQREFYRNRAQTAYAMRRFYGATVKQMAERFGVSVSMADLIVRRGEREHREQPADLSVRARNVVLNALAVHQIYPSDPYNPTRPNGPFTPLPAAAAKLSEYQLSRTPNCGRRTFSEIEDWLAAHGLHLTSSRSD